MAGVQPSVKRSPASSVCHVSRVHGHISTDQRCAESRTRGKGRRRGRDHFAHTWRGRTFTRAEFSAARQTITTITPLTYKLLF